MRTAEAEMASAFLAGDSEAADLITAWVRVSTLSFRSRLGNDWEDARQEAVTQLTSALRAKKFRGEGSLKAYVKRVANTTCLDRLRYRRRWKMVEIEEAEMPIAEESPESFVMLQDVWLEVGRVLALVPDGCRELWRMIIAGQSYREMGQRLGIAEATLRVRVLRCRRRALEVREKLLCNEIPSETPSHSEGGT